MVLTELGLIGNCQVAAHVRGDGAIVWCCLPRFDSQPVFAALLDEEGFCSAPQTKMMWGNFPQAYSHVGLIHAAFAASPRWSEVAP